MANQSDVFMNAHCYMWNLLDEVELAHFSSKQKTFSIEGILYGHITYMKGVDTNLFVSIGSAEMEFEFYDIDDICKCVEEILKIAYKTS